MTDPREPLFGAAADSVRDQLREPTDLQVAISVGQQLLDSDSPMSVHEALRLLLRALNAEPNDKGYTLTGTPGDLGAEPDDAKLPDAGKLPPRCPDRALLQAVHEAIAIPYPATVGDSEVHDRILSDRVMDARVALEGVLHRGDDPGWSADYLRVRLAEKPATGYRTAGGEGQ